MSLMKVSDLDVRKKTVAVNHSQLCLTPACCSLSSFSSSVRKFRRYLISELLWSFFHCGKIHNFSEAFELVFMYKLHLLVSASG